MDSAVSFYATYNSEALQNLAIGDFGKVRLADNRTLKVTVMGDIVLKIPVGFWTLKDVRVVPSLTKSVISVRQLDEQGHDVKFGNQQWKVFKEILSWFWFIESRGQKRVVFTREKPRATG